MLKKCKLIFAKGSHPYSYLTRLRYQSRWSHVGWLDGDVVHEAINPEGVVKTPLSVFIERYGLDNISIVETYAEDGYVERAEEMLGMGYDFWGAFGMGVGTRKLDHPDKVWCSHHVGYILGTFRPERLNRLSPEHIWIMTKDIQE